MRVGIVGGTFDPIHVGHLIIAEGARVKLGLARILFVPAGQPWLKVNRTITSVAHRVEMTRRAIAANYSRLESDLDMRQIFSLSLAVIAWLNCLYGENRPDWFNYVAWWLFRG
jgi:cytidyltransferase-like protein